MASTTSKSKTSLAAGRKYKGNVGSYASWVGFVPWSKTTEFAERLAENSGDAARALESLAEACEEDGYRLQMAFKKSDGVWDVGLYGAFVDSKHAGYMLNVRHRSYERALCALQVLHFDLFDGCWPVGDDRVNDEYDW